MTTGRINQVVYIALWHHLSPQSQTLTKSEDYHQPHHLVSKATPTTLQRNHPNTYPLSFNLVSTAPLTDSAEHPKSSDGPMESKIPLKEHIPRLHPLHLGYVVYTVQDILTQSTKSSFSDLPNSIQQHIMRPAVETCKTAPMMPSLQPAPPYAPTMHNAQQVNCRCFYTICLVFNFSYCLTINSFNPTNIAYRYAVKLESRLMFSRVIQGPQCVKSHVGAFECTRRSCRTKDFIT